MTFILTNNLRRTSWFTMEQCIRTIYDFVLDAAGMLGPPSSTVRPHSCPEPVYDASTSSNVR